MDRRQGLPCRAVPRRWQQAGQLHQDGGTHNVCFEAVPADADVQADVDAAYREKYRTSGYLGSMVSSQARGATVRVSMREH